MLVLGIESTCDETAAAVVKGGKTLLSQEIASSADLHARYGGVFPELACRRHIEAILPVIEAALRNARVSPQEIDLIAVAQGPGLIGALLIGMQVAKGLSIAWNKPLMGVNHVEAHLYAAMMGLSGFGPFPALGLVLSGGHTLMFLMEAVGVYHLLGGTVDDAIGEAFDKVAKLLGFPYPGGPHVEELAHRGDPHRHPFKAGRVRRSPLDFSFSGIKTSVLYEVQGKNLSQQERADIAASFQKAAFADIACKIERALQKTCARAIYFGGGVSSNQALRALMAQKFPSLSIFWPPKGLSLDNAVMIAGLGFQKFQQTGQGDPLDLEVYPRGFGTAQNSKFWPEGVYTSNSPCRKRGTIGYDFVVTKGFPHGKKRCPRTDPPQEQRVH